MNFYTVGPVSVNGPIYPHAGMGDLVRDRIFLLFSPAHVRTCTSLFPQLKAARQRHGRCPKNDIQPDKVCRLADD